MLVYIHPQVAFLLSCNIPRSRAEKVIQKHAAELTIEFLRRTIGLLPAVGLRAWLESGLIAGFGAMAVMLHVYECDHDHERIQL